MSAIPNQPESGLQVVQPTPLPAAQRGPRLGLPTKAELDSLMAYGQVIVKSGLAPAHIKTAEAAIVMMRYGHQLGIDEFTALQNMYIQNGKPTAFASLLHSLILRDHTGDAIHIVEASPKRCALSCARRDAQKRTEITYTIEEAKAAGLLEKATWKQYPADMLFARCISRAGRMLYRDSTLGLYVPEELGANVIEVNGEVIDLSADPDIQETKPANPNRLANLHRIGGERGLDHDALHRIAELKLGMSLGDRKLTDTMLTDFETIVKEATNNELSMWSRDWLSEIAAAEQHGVDGILAIAERIKEAGITSKTHPHVAAAYQDAYRRVEAQPVEAEYREVDGIQADAATGEIVESAASDAAVNPGATSRKKPVAEFGKPETATAGADRYTQ